MEIKQLTFTRFIAAFTIVLFHYGQSAIPFDTGLLGHFAKDGAFAVSYFFCLSGYILAHVYYKVDSSPINKKAFFLKRFARIYPIYFIGFIVVLLSGIIFFNSVPKGYSIILQALGLHAWFPGICLEINYPSWSLSVEMFFYFCFPFLINFFSRISTKKIIFFALGFWIVSGIAHILLVKQTLHHTAQWEEFIIFNPLFHINAFIFGMAACIVLKRNNDKFQLSNFISSSIFIITCLILFFIIATDNFFLPWGHNGLFSPIFILLIVSLQLNTGIIANLFSLRPFVFLGEISFGIYILQHPVRMWFEEAFKNSHLTKTTTFYLFAMILILVAGTTYVAIEKPLRKWMVKKYGN